MTQKYCTLQSTITQDGLENCLYLPSPLLSEKSTILLCVIIHLYGGTITLYNTWEEKGLDGMIFITSFCMGKKKAKIMIISSQTKSV